MSGNNPFRDMEWEGFDVTLYDGTCNAALVELPEGDHPMLMAKGGGSLDVIVASVNTAELFIKNKLNLQKKDVYERVVVHVGVDFVDLIKQFIAMEDDLRDLGVDVLLARRQCAMDALVESLELLNATTNEVAV